MAGKKSNLSKEDIQAIALEICRQQNQNQTTQHADTRASNAGAKSGNDQPSQKRKKREAGENASSQKNIVSIGLFLFWGVLFVALLVKLWAYI